MAVWAAAVFFWPVNTWPGWQVVPFFDETTVEVLGILNFSILVSAVVNLVNLGADRNWPRAPGAAVASAMGLAVLGCLFSLVVQAITIIRMASGATTGGRRQQTRKTFRIPIRCRSRE